MKHSVSILKSIALILYMCVLKWLCVWQGNKSVCLQGCAETSVWTKFCEVELPMAVHQTLAEPNM